MKGITFQKKNWNNGRRFTENDSKMIRFQENLRQLHVIYGKN